MKVNCKGKLKGNTRNNYSLIQKLAIVDRARILGKKPTSREMGIAVSMIHRWEKQQESMLELADKPNTDVVQRKRLNGNGRSSTISTEAEEEFVKWFDFMRDEATMNGAVRVNIQMCVEQLRILDPTLKEVTRLVLRRRIWRMFRRLGIGERAITHQMQRTRQCKEVMRCWGEYIVEKMEMLGIGMESVCNFDETNVFFVPDCKRTLCWKGGKNVPALKAASSQRCTVMLGVTGSGFKFPPYIIFKGMDTSGGLISRQLKRVEAAKDEVETLDGFPTSNGYAVQENGWMNSKLMLDWVEKCFRPWAEATAGPKILILDEFSGHMTTEVRAAVVDCGVFLEFIPGGYTWRLQVLDVGINKPFKNHLRDSYDTWFSGNDYDAKPQRSDVATWVKDAMNAVEKSTIKRTWKRVGVEEKKNEDNEQYNDDIEIDMLGFERLGINELTEEEVEVDEHYNDYQLE